ASPIRAITSPLRMKKTGTAPQPWPRVIASGLKFQPARPVHWYRWNPTTHHARYPRSPSNSGMCGTPAPGPTGAVAGATVALAEGAVSVAESVNGGPPINSTGASGWFPSGGTAPLARRNPQSGRWVAPTPSDDPPYKD